MNSVSVIVATYNQGRYLSEALESILNQTCPEMEVIVVDDGSSDGTKEVVQSFSGRGPIRYIHQTHKGISAARNGGIRAAKGDYIAFLDADDFWPCREKLTMQVDYLDTHPEVGWVFGDAHPFGREEVLSASYLKSAGYYTVESPNAELFPLTPALICADNGFFIPTGTLLIRRSCLDRVGLFDEGLAMFEDSDLWIRLHRAYRIALFRKVFLARRIHPDNSGYRRFFHLEDLERLIQKHQLEKEGIRFKPLAQKAYYMAGHFYLRKGSAGEARREFLKSLGYGVKLGPLLYYFVSFLGADASLWMKRIKGALPVRKRC